MRVLRPAVARPHVVVVHRARVERERVHVDDHLAALGRQLDNDAVDARDVDLAAGATHDEHLGAAGAVQLYDRAELLARGRPDGEALELVPQPAAGLTRLVRRVDLEVGVAERLGRVPGRDVAETEPPARAVGDRRRVRDDQALARAFRVAPPRRRNVHRGGR
jgi:hypothetical protein